MDKQTASIIFEGYYNPESSIILFKLNDTHCFCKPETTEEIKLLQEKEQFFINESRHIDFTFYNVITYLKDLVEELCTEPKKQFPNHFRPEELLDYNNLIYSGYAYNDVVHNVFESDEYQAQHCIYIYPFYDSKAEYAYTIEKTILPVRYETESDLKRVPIVIAINLHYMTNKKCIAGTLYHEFNHILKMYIMRHGTLIDSRPGYPGAFQFLNDEYDFLKKGNNYLYNWISNFLYEISKPENDAMIQSIYGAVEEYSDTEIKKIMGNSKDEIRMVLELDKQDVCDLRYISVTNRFEQIRSIKNNVLTWLIIGNRYLECIFDKPLSMYFDISYVKDFFFDNVQKDEDTINEIKKDIYYIRTLVEKHIRKYKKKVESVTKDCLIERGFIDGTVNRDDMVYAKDIDLTTNRIKHKTANVYDDYDKETLKRYKDMLSDL